MVHTFQCLGVNIAVDVNSGAVHVLDELTYHLLEQVKPPMGALPGGALRQAAPVRPSRPGGVLAGAARSGGRGAAL